MAGSGIAVARVAGLLTSVVAARALGVEKFAIYAIAFTVFSTLLPFSTFADSWLLSRWDQREQRSEVEAVAWRLKSAIGGLTVVAAVVMALFPGSLAIIGLSPGLLLAATVAAWGGALAITFGTVHQARGDYAAYAMWTAAFPVATLLLTWVAVVSGATSPLILVWAIAAGYAPALVLALAKLRRGATGCSRMAALGREAWSFGVWVTIGAAGYVVFQRLDMFLLAGFGGERDIGLYGVAIRVASIGALGGSTLTAALMPTGSLPSTWARPDARQSYYADSVMSIAAVSGILVVLFIVAAPLIRFMFGADYARATAPSRILLLGQLILLWQMPFYFAFYGLKGERWIAGIGLSQVVVAGTVGLALIPRLGIYGAAWSNVATYGMGAVVVAWYHIQRTRRDTSG